MLKMNMLFDLDDTLHDKKASLRHYALSLWENNSSQIESDLDCFIEAFVDENSIIQPKVNVFNKLSLRFNIPRGKTKCMLSDFDNNFHEFAVPFPNALDILRFLKNKGVKIGCVTNGRDFFQKNKISALGFKPYFDAVVTSGGFGIKKPDHSIFLKSLRSLDSIDDVTSFCGDSLRADIIPAKELGFTTIWKSEKSSDLADYSFNEFKDFYQIWDDIADKAS